MKRVLLICGLALLTLVLASSSAFAQEDTDFCGIPEGCDLDGDGNPDVPAGTPAPPEDQYTDEITPVGGQTGDDDAQPVAPSAGATAPADAAGQTQTPYSPPESQDSGAGNSDASSTVSPGSASAASSPEAVSSSASATMTVLPDTGGIALPALVGLFSLLLGVALIHRVR